ncbi:general transcription factor II-I repeat domain-containing protein 2A-like [Sipha flava]|uniref:General transcription factor II-I repeat domain-containing protein 2A-like n=1 Tax=Sipha flava TaxID=143950 RepID=A0A8B8FMD5_9HEMI|nr:general transcription factor II-I repeat domain-containing protein 2A-like [Sipha flava]
MTDTTTGSDLYDCVEKCLNELEVDWNNFSSITDGAPAILSVKTGLVSRLKSKAMTYGVELKSLHFIKSVNWIRSRALNHRQFSTLLDEMDAQYGCLLYYSEIVPELTKNDWIKDLAFLVDITAHLNMLNLQLQGKNKVITNIEPFSINVEHVKEDLQLELIDLQFNSVLKSKFETVGVPEIFKYLGNSYPKLKKHFSNILSMFGSSYLVVPVCILTLIANWSWTSDGFNALIVGQSGIQTVFQY